MSTDAAKLAKSAKSPSLYDILLPGTHDSAAYRAQPLLLSRTAPPFMAAGAVRGLTSRLQAEFALTQSLSIREQLEAGARFLDLRISKRAGTPEDVDLFWTIHGMVLCVPLEEILEQLTEFQAARYGLRYGNMNENYKNSQPDAPVVLAVRTYALSDAENASLGRLLVEKLGGDVFVGDSDSLGHVSVDELPPFVLAGIAPSQLSSDWGQDCWKNTYSSEKKIAFLEETLDTSESKRYRTSRSLLVFGWTVTPNVFDVALRWASWGTLRRTVMEEAADMNLLFHKFAHDKGNEIREKVNVVFFDCFSEKEAQLVSQVAAVEGRDNEGIWTKQEQSIKRIRETSEPPGKDVEGRNDFKMESIVSKVSQNNKNASIAVNK